MQFRNNKVEGDLEFAGLATGAVRVPVGVTLLLTGTAALLEVEAGGRAIVTGTIINAVLNGGDVKIHGCVGSVIDTGSTATTKIMPNAIIGGIGQ